MLLGTYGDVFIINKVCFLYMFYLPADAAALSVKSNMNIANTVCDLQRVCVCVCVCLSVSVCLCVCVQRAAICAISIYLCHP